jgi:hypothetical protein
MHFAFHFKVIEPLTTLHLCPKATLRTVIDGEAFGSLASEWTWQRVAAILKVR